MALPPHDDGVDSASRRTTRVAGARADGRRGYMERAECSARAHAAALPSSLAPTALRARARTSVCFTVMHEMKDSPRVKDTLGLCVVSESMHSCAPGAPRTEDSA